MDGSIRWSDQRYSAAGMAPGRVAVALCAFMAAVNVIESADVGVLYNAGATPRKLVKDRQCSVRWGCDVIKGSPHEKA